MKKTGLRLSSSKNIFIAIILMSSFSFRSYLSGQVGGGMAQQTVRPVRLVDFLGMDYDKIGYTLNPGEDLSLLFRNNQDKSSKIPFGWSLTKYTGELLTSGKSELALHPGETGSVNIELPSEMNDGPYIVNFILVAPGWQGSTPFYFDYRKPIPDKDLNINLVSFVENMDSEGWVRMMMGPLSRYANIRHDWPVNFRETDAVVVVAEALDTYNPRLIKLQDYVRQGGTMIIFGQPAPVLSGMLPVTAAGSQYVSGTLPILEKPVSLSLLPEGSWGNFKPGADQFHYGLKVVVKQGAKVLANWSDGTPAVVSGSFGKGRVIYVGTGSGQVWQHRPSLDGADELALRLLYGVKGGDDAVNAMLEKAETIYKENVSQENSMRDRVLKDMKISRPENFVAVGKNNIGRFGWLIYEGGLTESLLENGRVDVVGTRDWQIMGGPPMTVEPKLAFSIATGDSSQPKPGTVNQNWFSKKIEWNYKNGTKVSSTMSLGSPCLLWEGSSQVIKIRNQNISHIAFQSKNGIRIIAAGEAVDPSEINENWILAFTADQQLRDMPQLVILTRRPVSVTFKDGISFNYGTKGFGALFTSRLWGVRRLAPGQTIQWTRAIPPDAINDARRWSQIALKFPVDCEEIGWVEREKVMLADRFIFKEFVTDWKTRPLEVTILPPVMFLSKSVGSPIELPDNLIDLNCFTKFGPIKAVKGSTSLVKISIPPIDHRAVTPADGRMVLQNQIDYKVEGIGLNSLQYVDRNIRNESGSYSADLNPYDISRAVPFREAPNIDLYKWWYTFGSVMARTVYSDSVRTRVDQHNRMRYLETLNFYSHKSFVQQKREPYTGNEYIITFVWPTQTQFSFRNFNDANESSGHNAYCLASYARYYGDWTTLRANWNFIRQQYEYLPKVNDWACMASAAQEFWTVAGLDMLNSEPFGNLIYAYTAEHAGTSKDVVTGKVLGVKSLVPTIARLALPEYMKTISAEGDVWREFKGFYHFGEHAFYLSKRKMGGVGLFDTSKGTMPELLLAYKIWAPFGIYEELKALSAGRENNPMSGSLPDNTLRMFLGWNRDSLLAATLKNSVISDAGRIPRWQEATSLYDMALLCIGDIPVFLSDWTPAEYISGNYNEQKKEMNLNFLSHLGEPFKVRIYSQFSPTEVKVNEKSIPGLYNYDPKTGWLEISLTGNDEKHIVLKLGEKVAPLHPYYTKIAK
jgi:hypothetical protein